MKKILLILIGITLIGCGYNPIFQTKDISYKINNIVSTENKISKNFSKLISNYSNKESNNIINISIEAEKKQRVVTKDTKGNAEVFELLIFAKFTIENKEIKKIYSFKESTVYKNIDNKFEMKQKEEELIDQLIQKITQNLFINLSEM